MKQWETNDEKVRASKLKSSKFDVAKTFFIKIQRLSDLFIMSRRLFYICISKRGRENQIYVRGKCLWCNIHITAFKLVKNLINTK